MNNPNNLDTLPQELVDRISSYLNHDDLKNTLLLSRSFHYAAEEQSGAFSTFTLTRDNTDQCIKRYSGRRFGYLRTVELEPSFPALRWDEGAEEEWEYGCRDTAQQLEEMDQKFTRQINLLFYTIRTLETRTPSTYGPGKIKLKIYAPTREVERPGHCLHRVFTSWRVHLLNPEMLPSLTSVHWVVVEDPDTGYDNVPTLPFRKLDLRILLDLSSKLPNLETLECKIGGSEWAQGAKTEEARYTLHNWEGPCRDSRFDFSNALEFMVLPNLRHAYLNFIYPIEKVDLTDQRFAMPNMVKPALYDIFSSSLRILSYQLRTMRLRVVADETIFWPVDDSTPSWPNLESISVMFYMVSPFGKWYFHGSPGCEIRGATEGFEITENHYPPLLTVEKDEDADCAMNEDEYDWDDNRMIAQYRVEPNNEVLVPFLTAFAKAAASMPKLKEVALWSPLFLYWNNISESGAFSDFDSSEILTDEATREVAWGIAYTRPGAKAFNANPGEDQCDVRQMWWEVREWRPDPELHELFQQIGHKEHGGEMKEYWTNGFFGNCLVDRGIFDDFEGEVFGYD